MDARNQWQPVTDVYQQVVETLPVSHLDADPMTLVNAARRARSLTEAKTPFGISAITSLYFLRATVYSLFAAKLMASSDSNLSTWIQAHCPALIPIGLGGADPKNLPTTMAEALGVLAVLSLGMAFLWLIRWKPVLFISVAFSGYFLVHIAISYFNFAGLGDPNLFGSEQIDLLVAEGALNLLTVLFICLYPNLKNTFQRH